MNLNHGDKEDDNLFFTQHCLELAKLLRTDQTDAFLHLYDSLPSTWTRSRLEEAKETIRQYQDYDENVFENLYQRAFTNEQIMSKQMDQHNEQKHRITSLAHLQQKQYQERIQANDLACDEKHSLSSKKTTDEVNSNIRRLQSGTNNINSLLRTHHTPVDSFVQLNLKPDISITLEEYKKAKDTMPTTKNSSTTNRSSHLQVNETNDFNQENINKKPHHNHSHQDASFDYFSPKFDEQHSRSSSSSSINQKTDLTIDQNHIIPFNVYKHGKLIDNHDFDSHGSSITTISSSENSESVRTGSGSDSDEGEKQPLLSKTKTTRYLKETNDDTLTVVLNQTSVHQTSQHNLKLSLPEQNSYELVKSPTISDPPPSLLQLPRFKQPAKDGSNGLNHLNNNLLPNTIQSSQSINSLSSHQTQNSEHHEQNNINHSNSSRKSATRTTKKRKQPQQDVIRTELIPGHRGDLDVDELVMFIDGNSSNKQRQNSSSVRSIESNSNSNSSSTRRKSRKSSKILQDNESKLLNNDDNDNIHFLDHNQLPSTTTNTHSLTEQNLLSNSNDDNESHSNTTNGELSLPEWHNTSSINDELDSLSLSSTTLNNSNSEITSEPFVTVTHRRRSIKERRQENNMNNNNKNKNLSNRTSRFSDRKRFQPSTCSTVSNSNSMVSNTPKEEEEEQQRHQVPTALISPSVPPPPPPPPPPSETSTSIHDQTSPRLSSHSSSSSLSSLRKRQSKPAPPVVFLNKSIDVELNDVSFGFDIENSNTDKPSTPTPTSPPSPPPIEKENHVPSSSSSTSSTKRSYPQRNFRQSGFYSGTDIRPQQRNYSSQSSYINPYLFLQYNQQQLAYMNYLRTQYLPSQSPYVLIPTVPSTNTDEKDSTSEQIQEPLFVCTALPGQTQPIYYPTTKKSFQSIYPSQYFYPTTHPAYFQPISTSSLIDNKSQHDDTDHDDLDDDEGVEGEDHDYEKSTRLFHQTHHSSSAHIMSNALQLVYSQEKLNSQTDRFNLDQLTAYLAMKWTETVDHYEQGDDEILLKTE